MNDSLIELIRQVSKPLAPLPVGMEPKLTQLIDIKAVLFDVYGTLLVSESGDIGAADPKIRSKAFVDSMSAMGLKFEGDGTDGAKSLRTNIIEEHARARKQGTDYPEIDIVEVWQHTCQELVTQGFLAALPADLDFKRLAVDYETRVNPVWPMPNLSKCLETLQQLGKVMGIISNAQFFTPLIFPAICGGDLDQFGFAQNLRYYSYMHRSAKPGTMLYELAAADLAFLKVRPDQVLYVGNDVRNDIWPASQVGFRTVLFAGDARSLRMRDQDVDKTTYPEPDAVVTDLAQIPKLI